MFDTAYAIQLSREEEEQIGEEKEVRKVDQERINRFSRIHSRHKTLEDELKTKQVTAVSVLRKLRQNCSNVFHRKRKRISRRSRLSLNSLTKMTKYRTMREIP